MILQKSYATHCLVKLSDIRNQCREENGVQIKGFYTKKSHRTPQKATRILFDLQLLGRKQSDTSRFRA